MQLFIRQEHKKKKIWLSGILNSVCVRAVQPHCIPHNKTHGTYMIKTNEYNVYTHSYTYSNYLNWEFDFKQSPPTEQMFFKAESIHALHQYLQVALSHSFQSLLHKVLSCFFSKQRLIQSAGAETKLPIRLYKQIHIITSAFSCAHAPH